jgi:hypothetical protein
MMSSLFVIAQIQTLLNGREDNELDILPIGVTLEDMDRGFACSQHGAHEYCLDINVVRMLLSSLTLAYSLRSETRINEILSNLKLPILITVETMGIPDSCEFHIEFCDSMSHQNELALGESLRVRRRCLEIGV